MVIPTIILCTCEDLALPEELRGDSHRFVLQMRSITRDLTLDMDPYERFCHVLERCQAIGMDEKAILQQLFRNQAQPLEVKKGTKVVHPTHGAGTLTQRRASMPSIDPALPSKAQAFVVQFENGVSEQMSVNQIRSLMVSTTQERTSVTQDELNTGLRRISPTLSNLSREEMAEIWVHLDPENTGQVSAEKLTAVMSELPQHSQTVHDENRRSSRVGSGLDAGISDAVRERLSGQHGPSIPIANFAHEYLRDPSLFGNRRRQWGMMYCGGSQAVEKDLRLLSRLYGIQLSVESFAW